MELPNRSPQEKVALCRIFLLSPGWKGPTARFLYLIGGERYQPGTRPRNNRMRIR